MDPPARNSTNSTIPMRKFEFWSEFVLQTNVCLIGTILNLITVLVFSRKSFTATTYLFAMTMALADALTLIFALPTGMRSCNEHLRLCSNESFKKIIEYAVKYETYASFGLGNTLEAISAWLKVLSSFERYATTKWPHLIKLRFTRGQGRIQVLLLTTLSIIVHIPMYFAMQGKHIVLSSNQTKNQWNSTPTQFGKSYYYEVYTWLHFVIVALAPLIILCVMSALLLHIVWSSYRIQRAYHRARQPNGNHLTHLYPHHRQLRSCATMVVNSKRSTSKERSSSSTNFDERPSLLLAYRSMALAAAAAGAQSTANRNGESGKLSFTLCNRLERCLQANNKLTILLISIIILFLFGQIPQAFAFIHFRNLLFGKRLKAEGDIYSHLTQLLYLVTASTNFFLYLTLNRHFKRSLRRLCRLEFREP